VLFSVFTQKIALPRKITRGMAKPVDEKLSESARKRADVEHFFPQVN
jgi:hypothetical protein